LVDGQRECIPRSPRCVVVTNDLESPLAIRRCCPKKHLSTAGRRAVAGNVTAEACARHVDKTGVNLQLLRAQMRIFSVSLTLLLVLTMGCGGGSTTLTPSSGVSGAYEFIVTSNVTGGTTLVEANLSANGNRSSATGPNQVEILTFENKTWYVNGVCFGAMPGQNSVLASVSGGNVALTFNEGGNTLPAQGVLTGTTITGNYSVTGSKCPDLVDHIGVTPGSDLGGFVGNQVPDLAGTFSGSLNLPDGTDDASFTFKEGANQTLTVNAALNGIAENGNFTFAGSAVGNVMFVSGSVNGKTLSLFGYLDRTGAFTGIANSVLVFDYDTLANAGLLIKQ